jgi:Protein of unknown function (DUF4065)
MPNRLPELLHYVIWRCDPAELGATKLNKICWYADLDAYRRSGSTITGATSYIRLQHGPTPRNVHRCIDRLKYDGQIAVSQHNYHGRPKTMYMSQVMPNINAFSAEEISIIDSVAEIICAKHTASSISQLSHDVLWEEVALGAEIPISAAAIIPGEITADDVAWAEQAIAGFDEHRTAT